jgi:phosphoglycerate dehydrogenase-like enzyme
MMTPQPIRVLGITQPLCPTSLARLQSAFHTVHYHPSSPLPPDILPEIEALFVPITGLPEGIASFRSLPRLRHVQLASAGADKLLQHAAIREYATWSRSGEGDGGGAGVEREGGSDGRIGNGAKGTDRAEVVGRSITVSTASGIHVVSIPNWVVANLIGIYHQLPRMLQIARVSVSGGWAGTC